MDDNHAISMVYHTINRILERVGNITILDYINIVNAIRQSFQTNAVSVVNNVTATAPVENKNGEPGDLIIYFHFRGYRYTAVYSTTFDTIKTVLPTKEKEVKNGCLL